MTKLTTVMIAAAAMLALPAMATQTKSPAQPGSAAVMAVGNPHALSHSSTATDRRADERRRADLAEWQTLLGANQPYPAMGVGGHAR